MGAIAIVGIACQFPGARDLAELHDLTVAGWRMFRPIPALPGRMLHAALLDGWTAPGDRSGSGRVHKLAAETMALALSDASARRIGPGLNGSHPGDEIGVFLAATASDAAEVARRETGIGLGDRMPQNRYANSLHAVADACKALDAGLLDMALAGGVELGIDPRWLARRAAAGELGTCEMRVYDAEPAGVLPGDGCGIVVLMRSAEARAAELPVYAEIAGWATVRDDPEPADLLSAYVQAGVAPGDSHLVEGHGLGTMAADLAELTALTRLRHGSAVTAALGAVSGNIGHARAAAGAASLIKTVAAMVAGTIPPGTGTVRPHQLIESNDAALRLPARPEPWPAGTRLAAVNSLGTADEGDCAVHLVLRREPDDAGRGRRRRTGEAAKITTSGQALRRESTCGPDRPAHGKHAAPGRHAAPDDGNNGAFTRSAGASTGNNPGGGRGWLAQPALLPGAGDGTGNGAADGGRRGAAGGERDRETAGGRRGAAGGERDEAVAGGRRGASSQLRERAGAGGRRGARGVGAIFALCGGEAMAIAATLDVVAGSAGKLTDTGLRDLARQLAAATQRAADRGAPLRVTVTADTPGQLTAQARRAAQILRAGGSAAGSAAGPMTIEPGITISAGATGNICFVFPGLADSHAEHAAMLTGSLDGLRILDRLGVKAKSAVGYSFGEITGLVWAGCLPLAEAARLAALRARVLRACLNRSAAIARVTAGTAIVRRLCVRYGLHVAAYETPTAHLVAGPGTGIRDLARCGAEAGVIVDVLAVRGAPHSPAMASCAAPLRSVMGATDFVAPRRRLISTITGRAITPADDIADLLAGQLARPVLFARALDVAASGADLLVVAGPEASPANASSLAAIATAACGVPAIRVPGDWNATPAQTIATLFAAGAIKDLTGFLTGENRLPGPLRLTEGSRPPGPPRMTGGSCLPGSTRQAAAPSPARAVPTPRRPEADRHGPEADQHGPEADQHGPEADQLGAGADRRPVIWEVLPARGVRL
jgi:enediyne polyketide synthase